MINESCICSAGLHSHSELPLCSDGDRLLLVSTHNCVDNNRHTNASCRQSAFERDTTELDEKVVRRLASIKPSAKMFGSLESQIVPSTVCVLDALLSFSALIKCILGNVNFIVILQIPREPNLKPVNFQRPPIPIHESSVKSSDLKWIRAVEHVQCGIGVSDKKISLPLRLSYLQPQRTKCQIGGCSCTNGGGPSAQCRKPVAKRFRVSMGDPGGKPSDCHAASQSAERIASSYFIQRSQRTAPVSHYLRDDMPVPGFLP